MEISEFTLIKDGYFGGFLGSDKEPYKPLLFFGGKITINLVGGAIHISVDENTKTDFEEFSIDETMQLFGRVNMEDLSTKSKSRFRIKTPNHIDFLNQEQLYSIQKVIDQNTFVFVSADK